MQSRSIWEFWFAEGIVSVCVLYLQGDVLPRSLFFTSRHGGTADNAPVSSPLIFYSVWICVSLSLHLVFSCERACVCVCVPGCVSKCVLAACFVCCSCCDRWSAAHAQINRPTLMKSGFCLLSLSLCVSSLPLSSSSYYFPAYSLKQGHVDIQREVCSVATIPLEGDGQVEKHRIEKKQENKQ